MYCWQLIFLQSKANGGVYHGDSLSTHSWQWPEGTWLQRRLYHLRETQRLLSRKPDQASLA